MSRAANEAYKIIREQIVTGNFAPDMQLKEEELAQFCGVSRTPVRDALHRLEAELLVRRTDTQRTFVQDWSGPELADIFALRQMLETHAATRAAEKITPAEIDRLLDLNAKAQEALSDPQNFDREICLALNLKFHRKVLEAARSEPLLKLHSQLVNQATPQLTTTTDDLSEVQRSFSDHQELVIAFQHRDPEWARSLMDSHIRQSFHKAEEEIAETRDNVLTRNGPLWNRATVEHRHGGARAKG